MKNKIKKSTLSLLVFFLFTLISFFVLRINNFVGEQLTITIVDAVEKTVSEQSVIANSNIRSNEKLLQSLAKAIPVYDEDLEEISSFLAYQIQDLAFREIGYVNSLGLGINSKGDEIDFSKTEYFNSAIKNNGITYSTSYQTVYETQTLSFTAPIYENEEISGLLVAYFPVEELLINIEETFNSSEYAFIVDEEYRPVTSNMSARSEFGGFLSNDEVEYNNVSSFYEGIASSNESFYSFKYDEKNYFAITKLLEFNNWSLVVVVDEDQLAAEEKLASTLIIFATSLIFFVLVFFAWYLIFSHKRNLKKVQDVAYYDSLTGLRNINKFKIEALKLIEENPDKQFIIAKFDMENFKSINDLYSYEMGDNVIKSIAAVGHEITDPTHILVRLISDEFFVFAANGLLENLNRDKHLYIRRFLSKLPEFSNHKFKFRFGRYVIPSGEKNVNDIINKVTMAHNFAKKTMSDDVVDYDESFKERVLRQTEITNKMHNALITRQYKVYLQPKFDTQTEEIVGAEALVRWIEPDGNIIFPNDFIPLFELNGFILELDKYILDTVCSTIKKWLDLGKTCVPVSVNFSRIHITDPDFVDKVTKIVDKYEISHSFIEIELTETTLASAEEAQFRQVVRDLRESGFAVSVDDFGCGYSSLGMLKNYDFDTIKLDRSFFAEEDSENVDKANIVLGGIIDLIHTMDMKIVAEGVEYESQVNFLKQVSCNAIQGYYFAKPMPISEFEEKY